MENVVKIRSLAHKMGATGVKVGFVPKIVSESPSSEKFDLDYWTPVAYHRYSFNTPKDACAFQARLKADFKINPSSYAKSGENGYSVLFEPKIVEIYNQGIALDAKTQRKVAGAVAKIKAADVAKVVTSRLPGLRKKNDGLKFGLNSKSFFSTPWSLYGPNPNGIYKTLDRIVGAKFAEMVVAQNKASSRARK